MSRRTFFLKQKIPILFKMRQTQKTTSLAFSVFLLTILITWINYRGLPRIPNENEKQKTMNLSNFSTANSVIDLANLDDADREGSVQAPMAAAEESQCAKAWRKGPQAAARR